MKISEIKSVLDRTANGSDVDIDYLLIDDSVSGQRTLVVLPKTQ